MQTALEIEEAEVKIERTPTTVPMDKDGLPVLGMHEGVIDTDYRRAPGMNKSSLDKIAKSPATYFFEKQFPRPATPAMIFGSAFHCLVLEPEKFASTYVRDDYSGSYSKEAKEWRAGMLLSGLIPISTKTDESKGPWGVSDWDQLHHMAEAIMANPVASALIEDAIVEASFWWIDTETKKLCKGRVDGWCVGHNIALDLKTTNDATYSGFSRSIVDYRYSVQDAFYSDGLRACGKTVEEFVFLTVEKEPPYLTACYTLPFDWRQIGRMLYQRDLNVYKRCKESGEWLGLEHLRDLQMPNFAKFGKIS